MKKLIALMLALCLVFCLGCSKQESEELPATETVGQKNEKEAVGEAVDETNAPEDSDADADATEGADGEAADEEEERFYDSDHTLIESMEQMNEESGARFTQPSGVEYFALSSSVDEENQVYEHDFLANNALCMLRFSADFDAQLFENLEFPDGEGTVSTDYGTYARWLTMDGQYVLYCQDNDPDYFEALVKELREGSIPADN